MADLYRRNVGIAETVTASTVTLTEDAHAGGVVVLNRAAGVTVTIPDATGSGCVYTLILAADATGDHVIQAPDSSNTMAGVAWLGNDTAGASCFYTAATSDTITMDGSTKGGLKGAWVQLVDIAADTWSVHLFSEASGTEATPFSAAV